ncbi:MAG: 50S ribosomal protein L4 [bacterium]|nr:50S ribosomal protein L4 [Clostridia bacterium]MCR5553633.1 50S ribosomal protein L4 [bacterium]
MQTKVLNTLGEEVGKVTLKDEVFNQPYNEALIHQVVVAYLANGRQGTKSTLTRSEVRGGGRKPWRQKGTGNARQGSIRAPQWIKGGVVFAPKPRDFSQKVNKQMKQGAFVSALSETARNKNIIVVDELNLAKPNTKEFAKILANLKAEKRVLVVTGENNENVYLSARNIDRVCVTPSNLACTYDVVLADKVILTKAALKNIEEALK